jgi:thiol-disulfide isomerase/thioredoxin
MLKSHDITLNGLSPQTTFHYKVTSRDADGNEASSPDASFVTPAPAGSGIGSAAPDFTLDCADGSKVTLSSFKGHKVLVNFWHTSCTPCMEEMPLMQQMHEKHPDLPMLLIHGTALGPINVTYVGTLLQDKGFTFTVPLDITGQVSALYSISSVPRTFFIDANGTIQKIQDGSFSGLSQIEGMLASY